MTPDPPSLEGEGRLIPTCEFCGWQDDPIPRARLDTHDFRCALCDKRVGRFVPVGSGRIPAKGERVWVCDNCDSFGYDEPYHKGWCTAVTGAKPYVPEADLRRLREALHLIADVTHQDTLDWVKGCSKAHHIARAALDPTREQGGGE